MAISSALSFLSDRKRPIVVSVSLFLFNPAPSALPFFFSSSRIATFPPPQTPIPVSADASPPETPAAVTSDGSNSSAADPPRPDTTTPASDVAASAPEPDHSTPPPAAAETTGSVDTNETTATVLGERDGDGEGGSGGGEEPVEVPSWEVCEVGKGVEAADYIQCLDNVKAVKALKSLRHMEHRERHCPTAPRPRCLVPLSAGYRLPVPWPRSRDMIQTLPQMLLKLKLAISVCFIYTIAGNLVISYSLCKFQIWYYNVPHPKLVEYKKDQNWVRKSGNYFVFPGGGTQFKAGVTRYIQFIEQFPQEKFDSDTKHWNDLVSEVYFSDFAVNWSSGRNVMVMDMNGSFGGFVASLIDPPLWVMNVVPFDQPDTLPIILNRGLIGVYYDWCESFNTYPRTYDLLHMRYLLQGLTNRCDIIEVAAEIDRILRSGRWFVLQDTIEVIRKMDPVLRSLHYKTAIVKQQFLVATKGLWRPDSTGS